MRVVEIFKSIEGEGVRAGFPAIFIRLEGCNLRCSYCDTKYSYEDASFEELSVEEVVQCVEKLDCYRVTLTGGEPLIHDDIMELVSRLVESGHEVNIETNGSIDVYPYTYIKNVIITMDYKCPVSGMQDKMLLSNLKFLRPTDVLKFVVGSKEDLDICFSIKDNTEAQIFISPVFGKIEPKEIVEYMLRHNMWNCRIQLQLHKFIWDPNERGV